MKIANWVKDGVEEARTEIWDALIDFAGLLYDPLSLVILIGSLVIVAVILIGSVLG